MISIIMPVFNTGPYLWEAVNSVLNQQTQNGADLPPIELIVVDDHSTDKTTLELLEEIALIARVRVLKNRNTKGAAGARNTGIELAQGEWIGFLDSDDLWFPCALAARWSLICRNPEAQWVAAKFDLLKPSLAGGQFLPAAELLKPIAKEDYGEQAYEILKTPVALLAAECFIGIMTVLIRRSLVLKKGLFNESLPRSEDYHLWFKCGFDTDLFMIKEKIAFYRIHGQSLTHGDAPRFLHEDKMIDLLMKSQDGLKHEKLLRGRMDLVMQDHCYFYRGRGKFFKAICSAYSWIKKNPTNTGAWKELLASSMRAG